MSEIVAYHLREKKEIKIYDPTSGSGSLLINIGKSAARHVGSKDHIQYYAQELKENTYNLTRMNLVMRGILPSNIFTRNGDTLEEDWPYFEENDPVNTYNPLYVDAVVSNPPYSQAWNPSDKESDARYAAFGLAPRGKADYAFLLHDLYHLKPDGIMTIVLPHGVLFRGGEEGKIRRNLIEQNHIDAIIGLPANIFFGTGIPTVIMVLRQKREHTDILVVDASKGFTKEGKNNILRACDIKRIVDTVIRRSSTEAFSRAVKREEIRENDYNLNIPRYVDSSEEAEHWDIWATMFGGVPDTELAGLRAYWDAFPSLRESLFRPLNDAYQELKVEDLKDAVLNHPDVAAFAGRYAKAFAGFPDFLKTALLDNMQEADTGRTEEVLSADIFLRLRSLPLIDPYEAYQLLDNRWKDIAVDLETLQSEGLAAARQVDPRMAVRKKGVRDEVVQDGWQGRVIPFELAQTCLLADRLRALKEDEDRLAAFAGDYEELLNELGGEEREQSFVNEDAFVPAEVKKALKAGALEEGTLAVLKKVAALLHQEKSLKKKLREDAVALHEETKRVIENLSDDQIFALLHRKWITPLVEDLNDLPRSVFHNLIARLEALCARYETTLAGVDGQIAETETALRGLIDELTGNPFDMRGLAELKKLLGGE